MTYVTDSSKPVPLIKRGDGVICVIASFFFENDFKVDTKKWMKIHSFAEYMTEGMQERKAKCLKRSG